MGLWKIEITAAEYYQGPSEIRYNYTGTATTIEVAIRLMKRKAKKQGLSKIKILLVEYLGDKEFGK